MRISDWSSDVCSSDLVRAQEVSEHDRACLGRGRVADRHHQVHRRRIRGGELVPGLAAQPGGGDAVGRQLTERVRRSEEHTSELQSLMRISYAVFCLKKKKKIEDTPYRMQEQSNDPLTPHTSATTI